MHVLFIVGLAHAGFSCSLPQEVVAAALVSQFGVESVEDLGCGSAQKLISQLEPTAPTNVFYLSPLIYNGGDVTSDGKNSGGVSGFQGRRDALACLQTAPLLEDLERWTHWELIYEPTLGKLSEFLQKEAVLAPDSEQIAALELPTGALIRISPNSSMSDFVKSLQSADYIGTSGHLVSMMVKAGTVRELPIQLLGNHVESALEEFSVEAKSDTDNWCQDAASMFVFQCLVRIPVKICQYVANGVSTLLFS